MARKGHRSGVSKPLQVSNPPLLALLRGTMGPSVAASCGTALGAHASAAGLSSSRVRSSAVLVDGGGIRPVAEHGPRSARN